MKIETARTLDQNGLMWESLRDVSRQVDWMVNGYTTKLAPEDWKDIFTAGLAKHQRVAQGIEGGWVLLGERTSKFPKDKMADLITLIRAFGDERGVEWTHDLSQSTPA